MSVPREDVADSEPVHGQDGWELMDMDWRGGAGVARFEYHRDVPGLAEPEVCVLERPQPYHPSHGGWGERSTTQATYSL